MAPGPVWLAPRAARWRQATWILLAAAALAPSHTAAAVDVDDDDAELRDNYTRRFVARESVEHDTMEAIHRYDQITKKPIPQDKENAFLFGGDVKCDVCGVILTQLLLELPGSATEDNILDLLEASDLDQLFLAHPKTSPAQRMIETGKTGCARLFKDRFLAKGWEVELCPAPGQTEDTPRSERVEWACIRHVGNIPNLTVLNNFTIHNEAVYQACTVTIQRYRDELTEFLVAEVEQLLKKHAAPDLPTLGEDAVKELASEACRKPCKCLQRAPSESVERRLAADKERIREERIEARKDYEKREAKKAEDKENERKLDVQFDSMYANQQKEKERKKGKKHSFFDL